MSECFDFDSMFLDLKFYIYRKCTPSWTIDRSITDFVDLTYLVAGSAEYIVNGVTYDVSAGDLLCIPMGSDRKAITFADSLMQCYCLNLYIFNGLGESMELPLPIVSHIGIKQDILSLFKELNTVILRREPGHQLEVKGILHLILHRYLVLIRYKNNFKDMDIRIKKAVLAITDNYSKTLSLEEFARQFGLNQTYFGILFKQSTGMSFHQYLTTIRMNIAEDLLRGGEHSVSEVALKCGFPDTFYFSKVFKKNRGVSPSTLIGKDRN